jgi:hypothetical protein
MARTGEQQAEFSPARWDELRQIFEHSYNMEKPMNVPTSSAPTESLQKPQPSVDCSGVGIGPLHSEGVSLQTFFSTLRGKYGERQRDTKTRCEPLYQKDTLPVALEKLLTATVDPHKIRIEGKGTTFDHLLPQHAGEEQSYLSEEHAWMEQLKENQCWDAEQLSRAQHINLVPMQDFEVYLTRNIDGTPGARRTLEASQVKLFSVLGNQKIFRLKFYGTTTTGTGPA